MTQTLWPQLPTDEKSLRGMKKMLEEAGKGLTEQTQGSLQFRVTAHPYENGSFLFRCTVHPTQATAIIVEICRLSTGLSAFPASLFTADGIHVEGIKDEAELLTHLSRVFHSERTKEILVNLIANFG